MSLPNWADGGRLGLAGALAHNTVEKATSILGAEHPSTLTARNYEAVAYEQTGRASQTIAIFEPLLGERERILGPEHPDTLTTRHNLASAYQVAGRDEEAAALLAGRGEGDAR